MDDSRLEDLVAIEVLAYFVRKELFSPEQAARLLPWRHTRFSAHRRVRTETKIEAERVSKYMIHPIFCLKRLSLDDVGRKGPRDLRQS